MQAICERVPELEPIAELLSSESVKDPAESLAARKD
jgi:hypothetical protein